MPSLLERLVGFLLLVVLAPVLLIVAITIRVLMGAPVLFTQERLGLDGDSFTLFKFRTITQAASNDPSTVSDDDRLTPLGRWLRRTSIDELPELWNIARGEMAFVGPRPLPGAYRDRYSPEELRRHDVRPGLTGWAQINGRNEVDWNDRLAMDVWYVDHRSRTLDLKIIARTVHAVLEQRGISSGTSSTMEELKHYAERGGSAP